jgi:hypothetical protein
MTRFLSINVAPERTIPTSQTPEAAALIEETRNNGTLLALEGCLPTERGALVRREGDMITVTDGPFAEAREVVGGFGILELGSKEEAVKTVIRFLEAAGADGVCEIRELYPTPALAEAPGRDHRGGGRFLSIIRTVEREEPPSQEEIDEMGRFMDQYVKTGQLIATEGCLPSKHGARVRRRDGEVTVTDGPFTESKEVVGGFAILGTVDVAEAIELSKAFLGVIGDGECEIREVSTEEALARE